MVGAAPSATSPASPWPTCCWQNWGSCLPSRPATSPCCGLPRGCRWPQRYGWGEGGGRDRVGQPGGQCLVPAGQRPAGGGVGLCPGHGTGIGATGPGRRPVHPPVGGAVGAGRSAGRHQVGRRCHGTCLPDRRYGGGYRAVPGRPGAAIRVGPDLAGVGIGGLAGNDGAGAGADPGHRASRSAGPPAATGQIAAGLFGANLALALVVAIILRTSETETIVANFEVDADTAVIGI